MNNPALPMMTTMGGGTKAASFVPDISNYKDLNLLLIIVTAVTILDVIVLFFTRYFPDWLGEPLNKWYDEFQFLAVLSDVLIITIGFVLASRHHMVGMFGSSWLSLLEFNLFTI